MRKLTEAPAVNDLTTVPADGAVVAQAQRRKKNVSKTVEIRPKLEVTPKSSGDPTALYMNEEKPGLMKFTTFIHQG